MTLRDFLENYIIPIKYESFNTTFNYGKILRSDGVEYDHKIGFEEECYYSLCSDTEPDTKTVFSEAARLDTRLCHINFYMGYCYGDTYIKIVTLNIFAWIMNDTRLKRIEQFKAALNETI